MLKIARIALVLLIVGIYLFIPVTALASSSQLVVITASPFFGNGTCVYDFTVVVISDYEIQLDWIPGNGTGTYIIGAYGRWPVDSTDGFVVYNGNGSHTSHWLDVDIRILSDLGLYYKAYNNLGGVYSACFASGSVTGGGEGMANISGSITLFALIFFSLGSVITAYTFRKAPIAFVAAAAWTALAFFCFTQSASSNPTVISDYWMAIFWVGIAMVIVSVFEPVIMKAPSIDEAEPIVAERSQADEMRAEYEAMQKEMGVGIFKPRARKHRRLPKNW